MRHPQPAVIRENDQWTLYDQRSGRPLGTFATCFDAREKCRKIWPDYRFHWDFNYCGETSGTAESVRVAIRGDR